MASLGPGSVGRVNTVPVPMSALPAVQDPARNRSLSILKPRMSTEDLGGGASSSNSLSVSPMRRGRPEKHLRTASFNQTVSNASGKQDVQQQDRPASIAGSFWDDWNPPTQSQGSVASSFSVSNQQQPTTTFPSITSHPPSYTSAGQNSSSNFAGLESLTSMRTTGQGGGSSASFMFEGLDPFQPSSLPRPMAPISLSMMHQSPAVTPSVSDFTPRQPPQVSVFQDAPGSSLPFRNQVTPSYGGQTIDGFDRTGLSIPVPISQPPPTHPHNPFAHPRDAFSPVPGPPQSSSQTLPLVPLPRNPSSSASPLAHPSLPKNTEGRSGQLKDPFGDPV